MSASRLIATLRSGAPRLSRTPRISTRVTPAAIVPSRAFHVSAPRFEEAKPTNGNGNAKPAEGAAAADTLDHEIHRLKDDLKGVREKLAYAAAEIQNVQRTAKADIEKATRFGVQDFAKDLLDVADNFERCMEHVPKNLLAEIKPLNDLYHGLLMTQKGLQKAFHKHGLERHGSLGDKFDPNTMNALMRMRDKTKTPGTVGLLMKPGYTLRGRVIRAADVGIVEPEPAETPAAEQPASS